MRNVRGGGKKVGEQLRIKVVASPLSLPNLLTQTAGHSYILPPPPPPPARHLINQIDKKKKGGQQIVQIVGTHGIELQ